MIEVSMMTMNWANAMSPSAHHRRGSGVVSAMTTVLSGFYYPWGVLRR